MPSEQSYGNVVCTRNDNFPTSQECSTNSNETMDCGNYGESEIIQSDTTTTLETFWNISNTIQGLPILSVPYVIQCGGLVSVISLLTVAFVSCYTSSLIVRCLYERKEDGRLLRVRSSFVDVGKAAWKSKGAQLVLVIQLVELLLICSLYPLIVGTIFDKLFSNLGFNSKLWILISSLAFLPSAFIANLSQVAWTSLIVIGSSFVIFVSVAVYCLAQVRIWHWESLVMFNSDTYPEAIMWLVASYFAQPFVAVIEESMADRNRFSSILRMSFSGMTIVNLLIGVIASLTFFPRTQEVITNNLPNGIFRNIIASMAAILSFASFTLPAFTVFEILEQFYEVDPQAEVAKKNRPPSFRQVVYRLIIIVTAILLATVPKFPQLASFVGSLTGTSLQVILPTFFHIKLCYDHLTVWQVIIDVAILTLGIAVMMCSLYFSARILVVNTASANGVRPTFQHGGRA